MLKSAKNFILVSFVVFFSHLMFGDFLWGQDTLWQRDWYMGEGQLSISEEWNYKYYTSENLNTANHYISFMASSVDYNRWVKHDLETDGIFCYTRFIPVDWDLDGDTDVLGTLNGIDTVYCWYNNGGFHFTRCAIAYVPVEPDKPVDLEPFDIDGDGDLDIGIATGAGLFLLENTQNGFVNHIIDSTIGYHTIDIKEDTFGDIIMLVLDNHWPGVCGNLKIFKINHFTPTLLYSLSNPPGQGWRGFLSDFNSDGYIDFVYGYDHPIFVYFASPNYLSFTLGYSYSLLYSNIDAISVVDFDKDGDLDICFGSGHPISSYPDEGFYLLHNHLIEEDTSYFTVDTLALIPDLGDGSQSIDVDLDGINDIVSSYGHVSYIRQYPEGSFSEYIIWDPGYAGNDINSHWIAVSIFNTVCTPKFDVLVSYMNDELEVNGLSIFENQMLTFCSSGSLISSALELPEAKKPIAFGWRDCVPEGFEVRYYYRTGATFEECTSSDWTLLAYSGDSVNGVCGGWFQYKIEFERLPDGDSTLSPRVDGVFLTVSSCYECEQMPNPFTPNNDQVNDVVNFHFPQLGFEHARIQIFNLHGKHIRTIDVPKGSMAVKYSRWDGTDEDGNPLPPGLYVYIITVRGELVCEGTVTLAR